jgi:outer membrane protein assembly factor BamB
VPSAPAPAGAPAAAPAAPPPSATALWSVPFNVSLGLDLAESASRLIVISGETEDDGALSGHDIETGAEVWRRQDTGWRRLVATTDSVFAVRGRQLVSIDPATGRTRWELANQDPAARLTAAGQWLVAVGAREALAINAEAGSIVWRQEIGEATAAPVVTGSVLMFGQADGRLVALDLATGAPRWQVPTGARPMELAAGDAEVYAALANGSVCAFRVDNGRNPWCFPLKIPAIGAPLVEGPNVHVALFDNALYTLDRRTGSKRRQADLAFRPASGPQLAGTTVLVPLVTAAWARALPDRMTVEQIVVPGQPLLARLHVGLVRPDGSLLVGLVGLPGENVRLVAIRPADPPPPVTPPKR